MTVVLGLRCRDGVVLAADSQRTEQGFREQIPKLFLTSSGIVWGVAGSIAIQQELQATLDEVDLPSRPARKLARDAIAAALRTAVKQATAAIEDPSLVARTAQGLFAWHSDDGETYLLRVLENGAAEPMVKYGVVGAPRAADFARFALSQSEHLSYGTLGLGTATMVAFQVADDVIRASPSLVGHPVQLAVVTPTRHELLTPADSQGVADTLAAFRERQRDFLADEEAAVPERDTGIRPS